MKQKTAGRVERRQKIQIAVVPTDLQQGLHSCGFLWVIFVSPEGFNSWPTLKRSLFRYLVWAVCLTFTPYHLVMAWELQWLQHRDVRCPGIDSLGPPELSAAGLAPTASWGCFGRWQEQVGGCHAGIVKLDVQQVGRTNGGASFPLEMGSACYLGCVRKTSKYKPCHGTNFQLFDYPEPFWGR